MATLHCERLEASRNRSQLLVDNPQSDPVRMVADVDTIAELAWICVEAHIAESD